MTPTELMSRNHAEIAELLGDQWSGASGLYFRESGNRPVLGGVPGGLVMDLAARGQRRYWAATT